MLELVRRLGKALGYSGHASIEFHRDHRDGTYKYLELNPRIPLTVEFDDFSGLPTAWTTYRVALDARIPYAPGIQRDGLVYFDIVGDLSARLADGERFWAIVAGYVRMLARKKDGLYFAWDDPLPGLWMTWRVIRAGVQRIGRWGRRPTGAAPV